MFTVMRAQDLKSPGTVRVPFEGEASGTGVSFFLADNDPGQGPGHCTGIPMPKPGLSCQESR